MNKLIKVWLFVLYLCVSSSLALDVHVFDVEQANFVAIKSDGRALVVDCGTKRISEKIKDHPVNIHTEMKKSVMNILGGIKPTILISHMDDDHYCGLNEFFSKERRSRVIVGGIPTNTRQIPVDLRNDDVFFVENNQTGKVVDSNLGQLNTSLALLINGVFGETTDKPTVLCLLPAENNSEDKNDQSIVVKIMYGDKSVLLTGDASNALLGSIAAANVGCFRNIDVFLFAHHGSNEHVELGLLRKITNEENRPALGIISSKAGGASYIPKYFPDYRDERHLGETFLWKVNGISNLFPIVPIVCPDTMNRFCSYHTLSMYDKSIEDVYAAPAISENGKNIIPVFSTGDLDTRDLFYKITIHSDGSKLTMTKQAGRILYQTVRAGIALDAAIPEPIILAEMVVLGVFSATGKALARKAECSCYSWAISSFIIWNNFAIFISNCCFNRSRNSCFDNYDSIGISC